ncbi:Survival motor neuron [Penicillium cosmopolitanum]|uniref:Survival motor neuron n=1 Tax=Penicillium cosmopolitanum TaxID=1131564 RepID=A0A9W9W5F2_9EURO|nr:Survival motor neuron [Penicillium cosmopolitanum]KAJ5403770.1 Survival motor neuron [Penicillium cosmopolitanum]
MGKFKNDSLSHEEIWDDSALVRSWDEAVEEYQLYHSIHAKGENVDDVLREAEDAGITKDVDMNEDETMEGTEGAGLTLEAEAEYEPQDSQDQSIGPQKPAYAELTSSSAQNPAPPAGPTMPMPEAVMANVQDENLKRLMMSWYFAGYYTGLYEGQQKAGQGKS